MKSWLDISAVLQTSRALFWRSLNKLGLITTHDTLRDQEKDRVAPFDEYPACEMCGSNQEVEKLIARDGNRIVECQRCGIWFTSPRIEESIWEDYLKTVTDRSIEFTENRLNYGVALTSNVKYAFPDWHARRMRKEDLILDEVEDHLKGRAQRIHDVGCGVGYLLQAAQRRDIESTGNELNAYACQLMRERFGLTVYSENLPELDIEPGTLDAVIMHDYIEHAYHPLRDLQAAHKLLRVGGVLFVKTFHIDCRTFDRLKGDWNMLFWNHTFHFSTGTLEDMVVKSGFNILTTKTSYEDDLITLVASK